MDIDAFVALHQDSWRRLEQLTSAARGRPRLTADDLDELVHLYQSVGTHLARARTTYAGEPELVNRLTLVVADAHAVLHGQRERNVVQQVVHFAAVDFPTAVWDLRRFIAVAALLTFLPWAALQVWLSVSPAAFDVALPDAAAEQYIEQDFEAYYSNQPSQEFATQVFLNNVRVAMLAFAAGVLLCVVTAAILAVNGANGGIAGGLFTHVGQADKFWGLILPHGLLELSAVVVAGAAGLRIGWSIIDPGERTRTTSLSDTARRSGDVVVGLVVAFLLAAMVEGFVTGRPWPTSLRVGIGVVVFVGFWGTTLWFAVVARHRVVRADRQP